MKSFFRFASAVLFSGLLLNGAGAPAPANAQALFTSSEHGRRTRTVDVLHYALNVRFDLARKEVIGKNSVTFVPLRERLDSVVFDAADMHIARVAGKNNSPLRFSYRSPLLSVFLPSPAAWGDTVKVDIEYSCVPKKGLYFIEPDSAHPWRHRQIWTQGEDMDNQYWFPCYDFPNDRSTSEIVAEVPEAWTLVSNGALVRESRDARRKIRTFHWRESKPHSSYLIMLAAGEYTIVRDRVGAVPLSYYVYTEDSAKARPVFGRTPSIMRFFEEKTGVPYPWEKFSQIIIDEFMYGGMENTTVVTLNASTIVDGRGSLSSDDVIAHELAHQWWGDLVTCRDWSHLWLNEGFATYFEQLYAGHQLGDDEFQFQRVGRAVESRSTDKIYGRKPIVSEESFVSNLYGRGAWVLHMLHDVVGETGFWKSLRLYVQRHGYQNADTHELALAFEDATGRNLGWFFNQWLYGGGYPQIEVRKSWDDSARALTVVMSQTQKIDSLTGIFQFPFHLSVSGSWGTIDTTVWVSAAADTVRIAAPSRPLMVIADKGYHLLKEMTFDKDKDEYAYQLTHAADIADRLSAARELRDSLGAPGAFAAVRQAAWHDPFYGVRTYAVASLGFARGDSVRDAIIGACADPDARVRSAAAQELGKFKGEKVLSVLEKMASADSNFTVIGAALNALVKRDSTRGCTSALSLVDQPSFRNALRSSALRALARSRDGRALPAGLRFAGVGNEIGIRESSLSILGYAGNGNSAARAMLIRSLNDDLSSIRLAAANALGQWKTDESRALLKGRAAIESDPAVKLNLEENLK